MADNSFKINKSANFNPQPGLPANPVDGDFFYDATAQSFAYYHNGSWANMDSVGIVPSATQLTGAQFTPNLVRNSVVKISGTGFFPHLNGMASSFSGKSISIYNDTDSPISVEWENPTEPTANNRIRTPSGGSMNLEIGDIAVFVYDIIVNRWLLVSISSQAGAFDPATTTSNGLVALHQASATPWEPIVFTDGDYNTATGFVGLDAQRAAAIIAPLSAVTALTVTAHSAARALVLNHGAGTLPTLQLSSDGGTTASSIIQKPGSDTDQFVLNDDFIQLGRRQLRFSDNDGFGNHLENYMQYTYLGGLGTRGIKFVNQTNLGYGTAKLEATGDGFGGVRMDLVLTNSGGTDQVITNQQGNLYLNTFQSNSVQIGMGGGGNLTLVASSTGLWQFTGAGVLQALGTNRKITNVLDPVNAQDAVTKNWIDQTARGPVNLVQNGGLQWWSRAFTATTGSFNSAVTPNRTKTADRWHMRTFLVSASGPMTITNARVAADAAAVSKFALRSRLTLAPTGGFGHSIIHEFDRDLVRQVRGQKLSFRLGAIRGSTFGGTVTVRIITGTGGANNECTTWDQYTGFTTIYSENITPTTTFTTYKTTSPVVQDAVPSNATHMALVIDVFGAFSNSNVTNNYLDVTDVQVSTSTIAPLNFTYHNGSRGDDRMACQQYVENSLNDDSAFDSIQAGNIAFWGMLATLGDAIGPINVNDTASTIPFKVTKRFDMGFAYPLCGATVTMYSESGTVANNITISNVGNKPVNGAQFSQYGIGPINLPTTYPGGADWRAHWLCDGDLFK